MAPKDNDAADGDAAQRSLNTKSPATVSRRRSVRRYLGIGVLALVGPVIAVIAGVYIYLAGGRYVSTDNAYVKSAKIVVSADISGRVAKVAVHENQIVEPGALLFQIDAAPFKIALERAAARLLAARQGVKALRAVFRQKQASLVRVKSEEAFHLQQFNRQKKLARKKLISSAALEQMNRNLKDARNQVKMADQDLAEARARLGGDLKLSIDGHPTVREALAVRDQAKLDLKNTAIRASMRGVVTNFDLQRGEYVEAGKAIFSLVGADNTWVHANYKETELTHVRVGQRATISVDTYPDRTFIATVSGISPATGAEFALLPPQNATGNWVKVVQRLTVRLKLDETASGNAARTTPKLRAGMSAHVEIDTEHQRKLSGMLSIVSGWAGLSKDHL